MYVQHIPLDGRCAHFLLERGHAGQVASSRCEAFQTATIHGWGGAEVVQASLGPVWFDVEQPCWCGDGRWIWRQGRRWDRLRVGVVHPSPTQPRGDGRRGNVAGGEQVEERLVPRLDRPDEESCGTLQQVPCGQGIEFSLFCMTRMYSRSRGASVQQGFCTTVNTSVPR